METREAWPAEGIKHNTSIEDYTWGYLLQDGTLFVFDDSKRPSDDGILQRWRCYLNINT